MKLKQSYKHVNLWETQNKVFHYVLYLHDS